MLTSFLCAESQYAAASGTGTSAPVWPQDKHISLAEAFHFAACAKRLGRRSKRDSGSRAVQDEEDNGIELGRSLSGQSSPIRSAWEALACSDGLCGAPLGMAVKLGFDSTIAWLCCCLTFGGQCVVEEAERRVASERNGGQQGSERSLSLAVIPSDFDQRPEGYEKQESAKMVHPKPIPEVLETLKDLVASNGDDFTPGMYDCDYHLNTSQASMCLLTILLIYSVKHEITFVIGMLEYMVARISSPQTVQSAYNSRHGKKDESMVGCFLNLHCGHNNPFTKPERDQLRTILEKTVG